MTISRDRLVDALPGYEVGEEIGRGGWGVVYTGRHIRLHRDVAIKQLAVPVSVDPDARRRFLNEAKILASLDHPHVVRVHDFMEREDVCLLVMERLDGGTLRSRLFSRPVSPQTACAMAIALTGALDYAHRRRVLHRDVKPENILFSSEGVLKVTDFGIAKMVGGSGTMLTGAGYVLGTPFYLAPEQARSGDVTPRTDVYAAGVVLYELLARALPFPETSDPVVAVYQHVHEEPRPLVQAAPDIPPGLAVVVDRAISREAVDRFATAAEFGAAVAASASAAWGERWIERSGVALRGVEHLLHGSHPDAAPTFVPRRRGLGSPPIADGRLRRLGGKIRKSRTVVQLVLAALVGAIAAWGITLALVSGNETPVAHPSSVPSGPGFQGSTGSGAFFYLPLQGKPGTNVIVTARTPCPPLPEGLHDPFAHAVIIDPRVASASNSGYIAEDYIPLTPEGSWSGRLRIPRSASPGIDTVYIRCVAEDSRGQRKLLFEYPERLPFRVVEK